MIFSEQREHPKGSKFGYFRRVKFSYRQFTVLRQVEALSAHANHCYMASMNPKSTGVLAVPFYSSRLGTDGIQVEDKMICGFRSLSGNIE